MKKNINADHLKNLEIEKLESDFRKTYSVGLGHDIALGLDENHRLGEEHQIRLAKAFAKLHAAREEAQVYGISCYIEVFIKEFELKLKEYLEHFSEANELKFLETIKQSPRFEIPLIDKNSRVISLFENTYLNSYYFNYTLRDQYYVLFKNIAFSNENKSDFINKRIDEIKEIKETQKEKILDHIGLPKYNISQRYLVLQKLFPEIEKKIKGLDSKDIAKIISILMGVDVNNSRKLYNNSYKKLTSDQTNDVLDYVEQMNTKLDRIE